MAIDVCDVCNDTCLRTIIGSSNMQEVWRRAIVEILCGISGQILTPPQVSSLPQVQVTAATLQSSYTAFTSPSFVGADVNLNHLWVTNNTDADVEISLDGGSTVAFTVLANTAREFDLGNYITAAATSFKIKRATGQTAGTGVLYLEGTYAE